MSKSIKDMSFKEIDKLIDRIPRIYMKALKYQSIKKERPDYIPKHLREKRNSH